jgi:putative membrane protein insertion efficiency factor
MPTASETAPPAFPESRRFSAVALAALLGFFAADASRPVDRQVGTRMALFAIDAYRATVSPVLARTHVVACRFHPSCSAYGREAIARYGIPHGALLAAGRVLRCHPFAKGGEDPVP